jgi:hypothetical protein
MFNFKYISKNCGEFSPLFFRPNLTSRKNREDKTETVYRVCIDLITNI